MATSEVRAIFLPYCVQRLNDGRYVILNRNYKPLGYQSQEWVEYADYAVKLKGFTKTVAFKISGNKSELTEKHFKNGMVFLYNDGCIPTSSAAAMKAYMSRLAVLAKVKISK